MWRRIMWSVCGGGLLCAAAAFGQGVVTRTAAEELADLVGQMACVVPEAPAEQIPATALVAANPETCACCGADAWWHKGGTKVCGVCHPRPRWIVHARTAA